MKSQPNNPSKLKLIGLVISFFLLELIIIGTQPFLQEYFVLIIFVSVIAMSCFLIFWIQKKVKHEHNLIFIFMLVCLIFMYIYIGVNGIIELKLSELAVFLIVIFLKMEQSDISKVWLGLTIACFSAILILFGNFYSKEFTNKNIIFLLILSVLFIFFLVLYLSKSNVISSFVTLIILAVVSYFVYPEISNNKTSSENPIATSAIKKESEMNKAIPIDKIGYFFSRTFIRNGNSFKNKWISLKEKGEKVFVIKKMNNDWYKIRFDGEYIGYVQEDEISFEYIEKKYNEVMKSISEQKKHAPVNTYKTNQESPRTNTTNNESKKPELVQYGKAKLVNRNSFGVTVYRTDRSTMKKTSSTIQGGYQIPYNIPVGEYFFEIHRNDKNTLIENFYLSIEVNKEITKEITKVSNPTPKASAHNTNTTLTEIKIKQGQAKITNLNSFPVYMKIVNSKTGKEQGQFKIAAAGTGTNVSIRFSLPIGNFYFRIFNQQTNHLIDQFALNILHNNISYKTIREIQTRSNNVITFPQSRPTTTTNKNTVRPYNVNDPKSHLEQYNKGKQRGINEYNRSGGNYRGR